MKNDLISKFADAVTQSKPSESSKLKLYSDLLRNNGFDPLQYLGAGEYNTAFLIDYKGREAVAKVTFNSKDAEVSNNFKYLADAVPKDCKKHMPIIYDVISSKEIPHYYIAIVEKLNLLNSHVSKIMYGINREDSDSKFKYYFEPTINTKEFKYFKDDAFLGRMIFKALEQSSFKEKLDMQTVKSLIKNIKNELIKLNLIEEKNFFEEYGGYEKYIAEEFKDICINLDKIITTTLYENGENRNEYSSNFSNKLFKMIENILFIGNNRGIMPYGHEVDEDDDKKRYTEEKQMLSRVMPETKSLMKCLDILKKDFGIGFQDLHMYNLMERPGTRDIVISDPGLFDFM